MKQDLRYQSASDLGRAIGAGTLDPVELTDIFLNAANQHPDAARIYAQMTDDRARSEARAARDRQKHGHRKGPLDGVPVSWKDLFDTNGTCTEAGSALLKGRIPNADAQVLMHATDAGMICLGKTHMSELAFSGLGLNPITQTPPNVTDAKAAPGGSSSGAAASVAFGLAAAGIGSDTGGSVRIPAAWNNLIGLKTTHGLLSLTGVVPLCAQFDTVGPLCRSVEDASALLDILQGKPVSTLLDANLSGTRMLIPTSKILSAEEQEPQSTFEAALSKLSAAGVAIETKPLACIDAAFDLAGMLYTVEAYAQWHSEIEANPQAMFPDILERFRLGQSFSGVDYVKGWQKLRALRQEFLAEIAGFDAVLLPTSPILPPDAERLLNDTAYYKRANLLALRNTRVGNLMGLCALTLPTHKPACGLMMMGAPFAERAILALGHATSKILDAAKD